MLPGCRIVMCFLSGDSARRCGGSTVGRAGEPWLDETRVKAAVAELGSMPAGVKLLEANRLSTGLLLGGVTVAGLEGWDGGRDQTIDYVDWDDWSANDFLAVSQFRVATSGAGGEHSAGCDVVRQWGSVGGDRG